MKNFYISIALSFVVTAVNASVTDAINLNSAGWLSPGELTRSHAKMSGIKECIKCHTLGKGVTDSACLSCHEKLVARINAGKGFHASSEGKCIECHTEHKGPDFNIMQFDREKFDHNKTGYELKDKHQQSCDKCHKKEKTYLGLQESCLGCHNDVHKKTLADDCTKCHDFKGWKSLKFDHDKNSKYKLTGKHADVKCENCHPGYPMEGKAGDSGMSYQALQFKPLNYGKCNDCHVDVHKGELKEKTCSRCHQTDGWEKKSFEHNDPQLSDYKLTGKHENVSCENCHPKETIQVKLQGRPIEREVRKLKAIKTESCNDCHFDVHKGQFKGQKCDTCHTVENDWKKYTFKHEDKKYKGYKLEGKHREVECEKCHVRSEIKFVEFNAKKKASPGKFRGVKSDNCSDCHYDVHKEEFKGRKCGACHTVKNNWKEYTFRHEDEQYTGFKLEGKHRDVGCEKCHTGSEFSYKEFGTEKKACPGQFTNMKSDNCNDCHYDVHKGQFKGQKCDTCHTVENDWEKYTFKHEDKEYKGYKLEGKHREVECEKCHVRSEIKFVEFNIEKKTSLGTFKGVKSDSCTDCHKDEHKGKYEQACDKCHSPSTWKPKEFLHDPISFELEGAHRVADCDKCHLSANNYTGLDSDCINCHRDKHKNQFDQPCRDCHKQVAWIPVEFRHDDVDFRLSGTHKTLNCNDCHFGGDYRNASADCFICHQDDYQSEPDHQLFNSVHECAECHSSSVTWSEVNYSHSTISFSGAHSALKNDCSACHKSSTAMSSGASEDNCYGCHSVSGVASSAYERVSSPSHTALNFSTTCTDCHSQSTWTGAKFTHQSFRMRGIHRSLSCASCHKSGYPGKYAGTSEDDCYACHANQHASRHPSYPTDCVQCHSDSTFSNAIMRHENFELRGPHASLDCNACHAAGYPGQYAGTSGDDCYACHAADHSREHPSLPQDCLQCHKDNTWLGATRHENFNPPTIHDSLDCNACHAAGYPGQYAGVSGDDCYACHAADHSREHPSYSHDCSQCHTNNNTWSGATVHQNFTLRGAHASLSCNACHATGYPGQYAGVSDDDCYTCHESDYNKEHRSGSTPHDCTQCHSLNTWDR